MVVLRVLGDERLARIVEAVASKGLVGNGELAKKLGMSTGYVNNLCRRLEKWSVLRAYRDPVNGRILWGIASTKTAKLVLEELRKRKTEEIIKALNEIIGG